MKILHFILGKANPNRANGVNHVINGLAKYSSLSGHEVTVVGLSKGMKESYELIERDNFNVHVFNSFFRGCYEALKDNAEKVDIVHLHSVWQHYNIIFARYLDSIKKPYVITTHSGLTQDRIKQSRYLIKMAYHTIFQKRIFDRAAGIHAITREEMTEIFKFTSNKNIFFVQNGIDLENFVQKEKVYNKDINNLSFGYLGRFGQEKNISSLIQALSLFSIEQRKNLKCYLIGPIDNEGTILPDQVMTLGLEHVVEFTGALYGIEKYDKLNSLDFYIHPAHSDVVSIAVMEAMASGLPCIITRTSQVSYYYNSNSFVMVEPLVQDIKRGLDEMLENKDKWDEMSKKSIELVKDNFNWKCAVSKLLSEYSNILNKSI